MHLGMTASFLLSGLLCTEYYQKTDKDGRQSPHAQPENLFLLQQVTVGASVARGTETRVSLCVVSVYTRASVETRIIKTFVTVLATFTIWSDTLATWTPVSQKC